MTFTIKVDDLLKQATKQWLDIISALAPELRPAITLVGKTRHVPCPVHGGKDGFRLYPDANATGGGVCNTCGPFKNGISLLIWINHWGYKEALENINAYLNGSLETRKPVFRPRKIHTKTPKKKRISKKFFDDLWYGSIPIDHPSAYIGQQYLIKRGVGIHGINDLRYNPHCYYKGDNGRSSHHPALIALVRGWNGKPVTLHRTYLNSMGQKADIVNTKSLLPVSEGMYDEERLNKVAIRLFDPVGKTLGITESIETALYRFRETRVPTWAVLNAGLMRSFIPPKHVRNIIIFVNKYRTLSGDMSAIDLADKLDDLGLNVKIVLPSHTQESYVMLGAS